MAATTFFDDFMTNLTLTNNVANTLQIGPFTTFSGDAPAGSLRQVFINNMAEPTVTTRIFDGSPATFEIQYDNADPSLIDTDVSVRYTFLEPRVLLANGLYINNIVPTGSTAMELEIIVVFDIEPVEILTYTMTITGPMMNVQFLPSDPNWMGGDAPTLFSTLVINTIDFVFKNANTGADFLHMYSGIGGDPHVVCMDGTRLDVYKPGFYRYYDNCSALPEKRLIANLEVRQHERTGSDYTAALWVQNGFATPVKYEFDGKLWDATITSSGAAVSKDDRLEHTVFDMELGTMLTFVLEGAYNTVGVRCKHARRLASKHHMLGGMLAGQIKHLQTIDDTSHLARARLITLSSALDGAHALICGSTNPHIVSFMGASVPTQLLGEDALLLAIQQTSSGEIGLFANFDAHGYIETLTVRHGPSTVFTAKWSNDEEGNDAVQVDGISLLCAPATITADDATAEAFIPAAGGLRIRVQPARIASFSVKNRAVLQDAVGELVEKLNPHRQSVGKRGFYSVVVEPHLVAENDMVALPA